MPSPLLIHSDDTPFSELIEDTILFRPTLDDLSESDIDAYISTEIIPEINKYDFDIIYLKDSLSSNYLDFYGLTLAYHIRLSIDTLKDKSYVPIVILSDIDSYTINKLTPYSQIISTKNIFLKPNTRKTLVQMEKLPLPPLNEESYKKHFLNKIEIKPPKDYLSHHSITNEWAIYQWGQIVGAETQAIAKNTKKISSMLYFKYLVNKYELEKDKTKKHSKETNKNGKILLIDDKGVDGWNDIIERYLEINYTEIGFLTLEKDGQEKVFKDSTVEDLKESVKSRIESSDPDTILLDLRLLEHLDNTKEKVSEISGIQILKYIKELNPSIQIIIFSASTDSLILDELYANGILGYIKKDSPTNKYIASKNSLTKLDKMIKRSLDRKYLKRIWDIREEVLRVDFLAGNSDNTIFELRKNIESVFEILNSNIPKPYVYAMLSIYKCMELLNDYFILDEYKKASWRNNRKGIDGKDDNSTRNKIRNVINKKTTLNIEDVEQELNMIICSRNYAIHTTEKISCRDFLVKKPKAEHVVQWFEMLSSILISVQRNCFEEKDSSYDTTNI